jgi:hypothetical protein
VARLCTNLTVQNATNCTFTGKGHVVDPGSISQDVYVSINLATVKTIACLEAAFREIVALHRGSGYLTP